MRPWLLQAGQEPAVDLPGDIKRWEGGRQRWSTHTPHHGPVGLNFNKDVDKPRNIPEPRTDGE